MAHLTNLSVLCQAQNTPVAAWSATLGVVPCPKVSNLRAAFFASPSITRIGLEFRPTFLISELDKDSGKIQGVISKEGTYDSRIVRLYDRISGQLVAEKISEINGTFEFDKLAMQRNFYVVALEDNPNFDASIRDKVLSS